MKIIRRNKQEMSLKVENLENNMVKLTIEVSVEEFEKALDKAYHKNKNKIAIQGFRKGKAPRSVIEKMYGEGMFFEDAANEVIPGAYELAAEESGLDIVSRPEIDVEQIEKGKNFIFTATVAVKPEVTLGEYKGVEVEKEDIFVTEEEIDAKIDQEREQNSRLITIDDRPVEDGDITTIDFEGFQDGEPFEGGEAEDFELTIGSKSFIDTFEEQLIGKSIDEDVEVNVTFPEDYQAEELAGKAAMFKVKVKQIKVKELPELDDDFAQDVSEFDTLDEYKNSVKESIQEEKEKQATTEKENKVVDKVVENASMELPEAMIIAQMEQIHQDFAQRIQSQGLSMEQYFQFSGMDEKAFADSLRPQAVKNIEIRLVLEEIVKAEEITISEDEFNEELERMSSMYNMEIDKVREIIGEREEEQIKLDMSVQKAVDLLVEEAKEV